MDERTPTIVRANSIVSQARTRQGAHRSLATPDSLTGSAASSALEPEALAITGETITATGSVSELRDRFPAAEVLDFGDSTIIPGLNDAHIHLALTAGDALHLDLSHEAVRDVPTLLDTIAAEVRAASAGVWVKGSRYDDEKTGIVLRDELDRIAPETPVLVNHVAGHWGVVNSAGLRFLGIDESSPDPDGGRNDRYSDGRLNGKLIERALMNVLMPATARGERFIPGDTVEDLQLGAARTIAKWNAAGLTSICDALISPQDIGILSALRADDALGLRIGMLLSIDHYDKAAEFGIGSGFGDDRLKLIGVKAFLDGAIGGRTCLLSEPFNDPSYQGVQTTSTEELRADVERVHTDGNRIGVHANGDAAIRLVLDAFEDVAARIPRPGLRHRIEHCSLIDDDILNRMNRLGAVAVPFAGYPGYHGGALNSWYGEERMERMFAHRSFLDAGVTVAGSSDYPCGPYQPLFGLQSLVTRTGVDDGITVGASQKVTAAEALSIFTLGSAEASGEESCKGRLAPGYLADFTVLGDNPLTVDPHGIADIDVRATYVGGSEVYGG
ncbi:amidohydrolase [Brevibacterium aurantiacum]|uniref:Amidohydrolase n=1 Tax=Brevibacterium aurantiacum TaxID=273384 RepID=A0A556CDL6_BREAU|nr:amidohydrolase [Brevibacterium aurantiacum]TSI15531.1 amidohydrolase [Brevibacterium aurantiacum]